MDTLQKKYFALLSRSPLWAIDAAVLQRFMFHAGETWSTSKPSTLGKSAAKVSVIPVQGVLTSDGPAWLGSNYKTISDAAEQAAADSSVKRIVLAVDSPGGEVVGLPETAAVLQQAAKLKPMSAIVEGTAASAAYWLTSQAQDITITPSGEVGSVGVRVMHVDMSGMLDDMGLKVTELQAGKFKSEWSPYRPLSDDAKADMQTRLEATHRDFISAITSGRGARASADMRRSNYGEGRMFSAKDAMRHGLVDRFQSPRDFYRAMTQEHVAAPTSKLGVHAARVALAKAKS